MKMVLEIEAGQVARTGEADSLPDFVLTRNDGWQICCRECHLEATKKLWEGEWARIERV